MGFKNYFHFNIDREAEARRQVQAQTFAFIPCASGCEGSRSPVNYCRCVCQGFNHGRLRQGRPLRPVPVPYGYDPEYSVRQEPEALPYLTPALPEIRPPEPQPVQQPRPKTVSPVRIAGVKFGKKVGRSFLTAMTGERQGENELNEAIFNGLRKQYSEERVNSIIDAAFTEYYSHPANARANRPELYELEETGVLDQGLERLGLRWVIGRPKRKR